MPEGRHTLRTYVLGSSVRLPVIALGFSLVYGTVGYMMIEGFGFLDGLYMTVTTLTTVGFGEIHPLSQAGRAFTLSLVTIGFTAAFTLLAVLTTLVVSGQLGRSIARRGMRHRIDALRDHYVVCAFGRVGRAAVEELAAQGADVVVVEVDRAREPDMIEDGVLYILDDPTREDVLERAGIERARGLLCAVDSDASNVYITLLAGPATPTSSSSAGPPAPSRSRPSRAQGATGSCPRTGSAAPGWPRWPSVRPCWSSSTW